jgi:hypothetical protein
MDLVATIKAAWGWTGIEPVQVVGDNPFGNLIVKDSLGQYWRLCPEDLYCKIIAQNRAELDALSREQTFLHDWHAVELVNSARAALGPLNPGYRYGLKIPGPLGGEYCGSNLASLPVGELIAASGHIAQQVAQLPSVLVSA